jgi:hypothetical protein
LYKNVFHQHLILRLTCSKGVDGLEYHSKYDLLNIKKLDEIDWKEVSIRCMKYAISKAEKLKKFGINMNPEELIIESITRAYGQGENETYRNWNTEKSPDAVDFIKGIISSIVSQLIQRAIKFPSENIHYLDENIKDDQINKAIESELLVSTPVNPEEELLTSERAQKINDFLDKISEEDEELGLLIICLEEGHYKPRHIAQQLNCDKKDANNLLRKLRYKFKDFDMEN